MTRPVDLSIHNDIWVTDTTASIMEAFEDSHRCCIKIHAVDFSETRIEKAKERLKGRGNVLLSQVDLLEDCNLDDDFDAVITQLCFLSL